MNEPLTKEKIVNEFIEGVTFNRDGKIISEGKFIIKEAHVKLSGVISAVEWLKEKIKVEWSEYRMNDRELWKMTELIDNAFFKDSLKEDLEKSK